MEPDPTYTVFIRLPFPRNDFVDPPPVRAGASSTIFGMLTRQVHWDTSKDDALWNILSGVAKTDIDCENSVLGPLLLS